MYSLLHDRLISTDQGTVTLPEVLARLARGEDVRFANLQAYQAFPWHAFLVQLAALCLDRAGLRALSSSSEAWVEACLKLSQPSLWDLVPGDAGAGFMQQPAALNYNKIFTSPDDLDVLITTKNWDVKRCRIQHPSPDHWIYALISLQTMGGYLGSGNYGISRMAGGQATRGAVGLTPSLNTGLHFCRDVAALRADRDRLLRDYGFSPEGTCLLWTLPWDGKSSLPRSQLDPFYIEICRKIRLRTVSSFSVSKLQIEATQASTSSTRVEQVSKTGDFWSCEAPKKTISFSGPFRSQLINSLLSGQEGFVPSLQVRPEDGEEPIFWARCLVRGKGKTFGYHERYLRVPRKIIASENFAQETMARLKTVTTVRQSVLYPALRIIFKDETDFVVDFLKDFDRNVDRDFFDHLWIDGSNRERDWERFILNQAYQSLLGSYQRVRSIDKFSLIANTESLFLGAAKKRFRSFSLAELSS